MLNTMKKIIKRVINWIRLRIYEILYMLLLIILSIYIIMNWKTCITMKFFEQFDGNNILFLVWIVLLILPFYDVEAEGWKFRRKGIQDTQRLFNNAEADFVQDQINNIRANAQSQDSEEMDRGGNQ